MPDTKERLQQAIAAARAGNNFEAIEMVEALLDEHPNNSHALFLRGMLAANQSEQVEYLERVLAIDPNHQAAKRRMAQIKPVEEDEVLEEAPQEDKAEQEFGAMATFVGAPAESALEDEGGEPVAEPAEEPVEEPAAEPADFGVAETIITAAAVGAGLEDFDEDATVFEPPAETDLAMEEPADVPSDEATVEPQPAEAMDETVVVTAEASTTEADEVPEWLRADAPTEELSALPDGQSWADMPDEEEQVVPDWLSEEPAKQEDLPEWLTNKPAEEWVSEPADKTAIYIAEEVVEEAEEPVAVEPVEEVVIQDMPAEEEEDENGEEVAEEIVAEQRPKATGTRGLEIALIILVVVAFVIVLGLLYVIINLPL